MLGVIWLAVLALAFVKAARHRHSRPAVLGAILGAVGLPLATIALFGLLNGGEIGGVLFPVGPWVGYGFAKCFVGDPLDRKWSRWGAVAGLTPFLPAAGWAATPHLWRQHYLLLGLACAVVVAGLAAHLGLPTMRLLKLDRRMIVRF